MRVGLNLAYLRPGNVGGSEVYVRELAHRFARTPGVSVVAFCWHEASRTFADPRIAVVPIGRGPFSQSRRLAAENLELRGRVIDARVEVLFSPANFAAPLLPTAIPQVATIHDLQHVHQPAHFSRTQRLFRGAFFRATALRARHLVAISEHTREDVIRCYGVSPSRITTVLEGVSVKDRPPAGEVEEARARLGLPADYFYFPAMFAPHKNHALLLPALKEAERRAGRAVHLVLSGARTPAYATFETRVTGEGLGGRVHHLGFLERADVFRVLAGSLALVFPSRFEGFGLPVLEAQACAVPVIASRATSIPEVAGDGAILLSPDDPARWAAAMADIALHPGAYEHLVRRGRENVGRFSWDACAARTLEILERCASGAV